MKGKRSFDWPHGRIKIVFVAISYIRDISIVELFEKEKWFDSHPNPI